jgi:hypothetical protein
MDGGVGVKFYGEEESLAPAVSWTIIPRSPIALPDITQTHCAFRSGPPKTYSDISLKSEPG